MGMGSFGRWWLRCFGVCLFGSSARCFGGGGGGTFFGVRRRFGLDTCRCRRCAYGSRSFGGWW